MPIIVISYRRKDSNDVTRSIYHRLVERYGERSVYIDINSIQPSADYRVHIRRTLERALVVLAVIGNEWSGPRESGAAQIFDLDDPVRVEVETTLSSRRAVMPVLVNGARMPTEADVPHSLKLFPYLHAVEVRSGDDFSSDLRRLCHAIDRLTAAFWSLYVFAFLVLPFALLLFSYYLILIKFDLDPLYLRAAVALIAAVLGIGLCFQAGFRAFPAFITGAAVGLRIRLRHVVDKHGSQQSDSTVRPQPNHAFSRARLAGSDRIFRHYRGSDVGRQRARMGFPRETTPLAFLTQTAARVGAIMGSYIRPRPEEG